MQVDMPTKGEPEEIKIDIVGTSEVIPMLEQSEG